jgi:hypothetical protein
MQVKWMQLPCYEGFTGRMAALAKRQLKNKAAFAWKLQGMKEIEDVGTYSLCKP